MAMAVTITTTAAIAVTYSHRRLPATRYLHLLLHKSKHRSTNQKINCIGTSTFLLGLPSSSVPPHANNNIMKLQLASPFLAAAFSFSFPSQTSAFVTNPSSSWQKSMTAPILSSSLYTNQRRFVSSSMKELSVAAAAFDESTTTASETDTSSENMIVKGEVLSYYTSSCSSGSGATLVAVKICEEDLLSSPMSTPITSLSASGLSAGSSSGGSVPMAGSLERPIGLENALFSKSSSTIPSKDAVKSSLKRVIADGDPTGRTVSFSNGSKGIVLAHRHPISFVLIDASTVAVDGYTVGDTCSISTELASLTPSSIPPGSTVDYLGRHVCLLNDGSVSRSLPKAASASSSTNGAAADGQLFDMWTTKLNDVSPIISSSSILTGQSKDEQRPIFVPIPKISDIGLIDSPLVTGITAIDALTPIGLGQNMLVIAEGEDDDHEMSGKVNKRGWMLNLLRNVVENNKKYDGTMRCYYCLTSGDSKVRTSVWNGILEAGIQEDIVTLFSNHDSSASSTNNNKDDASLVAAEAVAVAAAACTLGEHHALTTGGDSVVIIDDINLHKSLWDMTTQELVKVYGVNAVVEADLNGGSSSEMRGFFSGLIQRAARFNVKKGGGSVTLILLSTLPNLDEDTIHDDTEDEPTFDASDFDSMSEKIKDRIAMLVKAKVPLTPTNLRKIKLPVPKPSENENVKRLALQHVEDLISMSDGQIWFDVKQDRSPPLDPSRSLTRVGVGADTRNCRADAPALRSVVGSLRFEFQQATDMMAPNSEEGVGKNLKQAQRRDAFLLAMHQEPNEGRKLSQECVLLLAASRGHLDAVIADGGMPGTMKGKETLAGMLQYLQNEAREIMQSIDETLDLSFDERNVLDEAIQEYFS